MCRRVAQVHLGTVQLHCDGGAGGRVQAFQIELGAMGEPADGALGPGLHRDATDRLLRVGCTFHLEPCHERQPPRALGHPSHKVPSQ